MIVSTLCYIENKGSFLMLLRNKKKKDVNKGKWIGVGGKLESGETPDECLLREVKEETGLTLNDYRIRGTLTFSSEGYEDELIFVYTSGDFTGKLSECNEGELKFIPFHEIPKLSLWEGDRIFLKLLLSDSPFFSLRLSYIEDTLTEQVLRIEHPSVMVPGEGKVRFRCPCCGSFSLEEKDAYEICSICSWEDDPKQERDPFLTGGANKMSLMEARDAYRRGK